MLQTQQDKQVPAFSYEVFDRQLDHFTMMLKVLMDGWEDYSSQEMTFDIHSLCTKAARLCYLADQDLALQHTDVSHHRKEQNETYFTSFELIITTQFTKFMKKVLALVKAGKKVEGHSSPMFSSEISTLLPKLHDLLLMDGMNQESIQLMVEDIQNTEKMIQKYHKITKFPGVRYEERLWYLIRLYCLASYLVLHFRRVCHVTDSEMTPEEAARLTEWAIQKYISEKDSSEKLELYFSNLQYDNDGKPLNVDQWLQARRELKHLVPQNLLLLFLNSADDVSQLGASLIKVNFTNEEFLKLVDAVAKYQIITQRIRAIEFPEEFEQSLHNEVFYLTVKGRSVNLEELKKSISKMVNLITRKNQWFCVWSVLKHLNLIKHESTFATFAHQMMSIEWFGTIDPRLRFTADNLSDYFRYFNEYDYTEWDEVMFLEKKELYGMTKWSPKLYQNFSSLCARMMQAIWGYSFFG